VHVLIESRDVKMSDADVLRSALMFLGWQPSQLNSLLEQEGSHSRSTTHRWLKGETPIPASVKLLLKYKILETLPRAQKPSKTKIIAVGGHNGGVGTSPFALTLAQYFDDFGLRSKVYHSGRSTQDTLWSEQSWLSVFSLETKNKKQSENAYLAELQEILSKAGSGELDLDCLVIDINRGFPDSEHTNAVLQTADAGIVLARSQHIAVGWDKPSYLLTLMQERAIPAKMLIKFEMSTLSEMSALSLGRDPSAVEWRENNYFDHVLIDNCAGGDHLFPADLHKLLDQPMHERKGLLMEACKAVALQTLEMLGLAYLDDLMCIESNNSLPKLEVIMEELTADQSGLVAASNLHRRTAM
jgi:hypothetical protein